jgi:hypothetical protein
MDCHISLSPEEAEFFLRAADIQSAARALIEFAVAVYGGERNISYERRIELGIRIPASSSIPGLFFTNNVTFLVYVHQYVTCIP